MKDPFEEFLEDAMAGPDLELGHDMRRRLLEAAVAGEAIRGDNVVRMEREDPLAQAGFDWLVGETPAAIPLLSRMIGDRSFFARLEQDRRFLRTLRSVMRAGAEPTVPVVRERRFGLLVAVSAAAALALAAGTIFFVQPQSEGAPAMAAGSAGGAGGVPASQKPVPAAGEAAPAGETAAVLEADSAPALAPRDFGFMPLPEIDEVPAIAALGGSGQSMPSSDPLLPAQTGMALVPGGAEGVTGTDGPALSLLDENPEPQLVSFADHGFFSDASIAMRGGAPPSSSLAGGNHEASIPEPGTALPVVIGTLVLMLRRKRHREETR